MTTYPACLFHPDHHDPQTLVLYIYRGYMDTAPHQQPPLHTTHLLSTYRTHPSSPNHQHKLKQPHPHPHPFPPFVCKRTFPPLPGAWRSRSICTYLSRFDPSRIFSGRQKRYTSDRGEWKQLPTWYERWLDGWMDGWVGFPWALTTGLRAFVVCIEEGYIGGRAGGVGASISWAIWGTDFFFGDFRVWGDLLGCSGCFWDLSLCIW